MEESSSDPQQRESARREIGVAWRHPHDLTITTQDSHLSSPHDYSQESGQWNTGSPYPDPMLISYHSSPTSHNHRSNSTTSGASEGSFRVTDHQSARIVVAPPQPRIVYKLPAQGAKKEFLCPGCDKVFERLSALKQHLLSHTGEKPHSCELCGRRFSILSNLRRHNSTCKVAKSRLEQGLPTTPIGSSALTTESEEVVMKRKREEGGMTSIVVEVAGQSDGEQGEDPITTSEQHTVRSLPIVHPRDIPWLNPSAVEHIATHASSSGSFEYHPRVYGGGVTAPPGRPLQTHESRRYESTSDGRDQRAACSTFNPARQVYPTDLDYHQHTADSAMVMANFAAVPITGRRDPILMPHREVVPAPEYGHLPIRHPRSLVDHARWGHVSIADREVPARSSPQERRDHGGDERYHCYGRDGQR